MNLNSSPSPFPIQQQIRNDIINNDQPYLGPINNPSSSVSCHIFFNSTQDHHNTGYYNDHPKIYHQPRHISDDNHRHGYNNNHGGLTYEIKNNVDQSGLKLTLWKKVDHGHHEENTTVQQKSNPTKWMSSKMRLMQKMKTQPDRVTLKITTSNKLEDKKSLFETETDNLSGSYIHNNNNSPIRVCSDCKTTKTPLWRSGPKGPKSLCNACGIRQRKARRAMAAAAAANGTAVADHRPPASLKIKVQQHKGKNGHLKKRCKTVVNVGPTGDDGSTSNGTKKIGLEDFLINLSKNLSFQRVFPEDEKDAAILLMALSSGLVHG